ncbi:hypothetical protein E2542_SST05189 [Spatholobus suberectus]|nr:hypothetical protein E2542_SST05189 [Spatholobus suberectus]
MPHRHLRLRQTIADLVILHRRSIAAGDRLFHRRRSETGESFLRLGRTRGTVTVLPLAAPNLLALRLNRFM